MFVVGFMYTNLFILEVIEKHTLQYFVLNTIVLLGAIYCSLLILSGLGVIDLGRRIQDWPIVWRNADSISKNLWLSWR